MAVEPANLIEGKPIVDFFQINFGKTLKVQSDGNPCLLL